MEARWVVLEKISEEARVFFMAVSKTASNSVSAYLSSLFRLEEVCPSPATGIWTHLPANVAHYRLFRGHFDHDFIDSFPGAKIKLVMLRDPCARLVSLYDFWRSHSWDFVRTKLPPLPTNGPAVAKSCTFREFLTNSNTFVQQQVSNPAVRQLLGSEFDYLSYDPGKAIQESVRRLEAFDWVGITEEFDRSISLLATLLGASKPSAQIRLNRTYEIDTVGPDRELVEKTVPSRDEIALMRQVSELDLAIYEKARRLLRNRYGKALPPWSMGRSRIWSRVWPHRNGGRYPIGPNRPSMDPCD